MGACFVTLHIEAKDDAELKSIFEKAQEDDRYENGHCYSGGIGMASGLTINRGRVFGDSELADEFLAEKCQKWENAVAVEIESRSEGTSWLVGAWCSS